MSGKRIVTGAGRAGVGAGVGDSDTGSILAEDIFIVVEDNIRVLFNAASSSTRPEVDQCNAGTSFGLTYIFFSD